MWIFRTHKIDPKCFEKVRQRYIDEIERGVLPTHSNMEMWIEANMEQEKDITFSINVTDEVAEASMVQDSMDSYYDSMARGTEVQCIGTRTRKRIRCSICLQCRFSKIKLECGHIFHRKCIDEWARWKKKCPVCEEKLNIRPAVGT